MKVTRVYLNNDGILIAGYLVERMLHRPVFYPLDVQSGFASQIVKSKELLVNFGEIDYREFYKREYPVGTRIVVLEMREEPHPVPKGMKGTVTLVDDIATIHCCFDDGRCLGVIPGVDTFQIIKEE